MQHRFINKKETHSNFLNHENDTLHDISFNANNNTNVPPGHVIIQMYRQGT